MIFSRRWQQALLTCGTGIALLMTMHVAKAALGEHQASIDIERMRLHASKRVVTKVGYTVHELHSQEGSHIKQFVNATGQVFGVSWTTQYKPDLSRLLGALHAQYARAEHEQAKRSGIQRHFKLDQQDLLVQSNAHLNVYSGFAMMRSLAPAGFTTAQLVQD
ncbi:MAG: hypothetical protein RL300_1557 [Pseudomonadota bacterium]|jgi:hypothetical protein